jgi:hypothetical protein
MKFANWRMALLSVMFLAPGIAGADCDTSRDDEGNYLATCRYQIDSKPPRDFAVKFLRNAAWIELPLSDLTIDKYKYFVNGLYVDVSVDIRNDGRLSSRATTVEVDLNTGNVTFNELSGSTITVVSPVPVIAPGATTRIYLTTLILDNTVDDFDIFAAGLLDKPTAAQPVYGNVIESDETDNAKAHACRVFGTNPVLTPTPPPVCD